MSCGICIFNNKGIAIAADSAATLSISLNVKESSIINRAIYNTVNKIFCISNKPPIGAIIYNNLNFMNIGLNQILSEYSIWLINEPIYDFKNIIDSFSKFLVEKKDYYNFAKYESLYVKGIIDSVLSQIEQRLLNNVQTKSRINTESDLDDLLQNRENDIKKNYQISKFENLEYIDSEYKNYFESILSNYTNISILDQNQQIKIWQLIKYDIEINLKSNELCSGVFFVGYGEKNSIPHYVHIEIFSLINNHLIYKIIDQTDENSNSARIIPMAQKATVENFLYGISPFLYKEFFIYLKDLFDHYIAEESKISTNTDDVRKKIEKFKINIIDYVDNWRNDNKQKFYKILNLLEISDLADFAENLVNMTILNSKFGLSIDQQTVGGPTDVAIISKSEGFVWIKKKKIGGA